MELQVPSSPGSGGTDEMALWSDILASVKSEVIVIIRMEIRASLIEYINFTKSQL